MTVLQGPLESGAPTTRLHQRQPTLRGRPVPAGRQEE
jgi:hypothetical protein